MSRMLRLSLALGERCRCLPSLFSPEYHLTLNTLDLRFYTSMLGKQSFLTALASFLQYA